MPLHFSIPDDVLVGLARAKRVSDGELAALKLALGQQKSKDIAKHLGISEAATRKRLGEVYRKFGIKGKGPGKLASLERRLMAEIEGSASRASASQAGASQLSDASLSSPSRSKIRSENTELALQGSYPVSNLGPDLGSDLGLTSHLEADEVSFGRFQQSRRYALPDCPDLSTQYCWNDAPPALNLFQGRREVLADLKQWILAPADAHKLLAICGIGGIGKTSLARKLVEELDGYFAQVVWLTARKLQTPSELLRVLLTILLGEILPEETSPEETSPEEILPENISSSSGVSLTQRGGWLPSSKVLSALDSASPKGVQKLIEQLISCFSQQPCLVVIDGFEAVFKSYNDGHAAADSELAAKNTSSATPTFQSSRQQQASLYRDELKAYGDWFDALRQPLGAGGYQGNISGEPARTGGGQLEKGAAIGMSCLMLTSREKPKELLSVLEGDSLARLYTLDGLKDYEAARMLSQFRLRGKAADYKELVDRYYGHPMALRLAANAVKDMFYGRIRDFLDQEISVFDDLRSVLKTQFRRLSPAEIEVMYWLAINHAPCMLEDLQADVVSQDLKENLLYTLQSLERRFLVDVKHVGGASFELHPIVAEYVLNRFIREIFQDLIQGDLSLFNRHALMKADAEDSCREFQKNAIVRPILERLRNYFKSLFQVDEYLNGKLDIFRENNPYRLGYAGGNFVNLMVELSHGKLSRKDFSKLTIWQAYLQGAQLRDVNFTRCELNRSVFTETVSDVMSIAFDDVTLACGDTRGVVHMWLTADHTVEPGQKCAEWSAHNGWVRAIAFLHAQSCLLTGGDDSMLKLWQLPVFGQQAVNQSMSQPRLLWQQATTDWVHAIALSPDEKLTAAGGENKITLYDTARGRVLCQWLHDSDVQRQNSKLQNSELQNPELQSAKSGAYQASQLTRQSAVRSLTFSPDGQRLASCGDDDVIRLWSIERTGEAATESSASVSLIAEFVGHTDWVRTVKFSADGTQLLSGSDDGTVRIWALAAAPTRPVVLRQSSDGAVLLREDRIRAIALSPDGRLLASGGDDCQVRLWDLKTQQLIETVSTHSSRIWSVAFQPQGNKLMLAAGGDKQMLMLWQIHISERQLSDALSEMPILAPADGTVADAGSNDVTDSNDVADSNGVASSNDGANSAAIRVKARAVRTYRGYTNGIRAVSFLGEQHIVSAGDGRELAVWSRVSGERKATFSMHQGRIWAIAVDPQNARIATASDDHT
ncbi:MAG: hypothetical protein ACFB0D_04085, partial [Phormidesmis sp.]